MIKFGYQKSKNSNDKKKRQNSSHNIRRKLKNDNLETMLKSSETLLEDFIEFEVQVHAHFLRGSQ